MRKKETDLKIIQDRYNKRLERQNNYNKLKYDHISVIFPAGYKEVITRESQKKGFKSVSKYFEYLLKCDGVLFPDTSTAAGTDPEQNI